MKSDTFQLISDFMSENDSRIFCDLPVICQDGVFYWSSFLLASSSKSMKKMLLKEDEPCLILPDFPKNSVQETLIKTLKSDEIVSHEYFPILELFSFDQQKQEPQKEFKCSQLGCNAQFQRLRHFQRHIASHAKSSQFVCELCGKVFFHEDNLALHMRYHEDISTIHTCPHCQYDFNGRRALQSHIADHHAPLISCPVCKKSLKKRLLLRHIRSKHPVNVKGNLRKTLAALPAASGMENATKVKKRPPENVRNAVEDLIESQQKRVPCPHCEKSFANQYIAKSHLERVHLRLRSQKELSCAVCEKKFVGPPSRLARHMREVHAENRFECPQCGHFFPVKASLERHLATVHHPKKQECPYCPVQVVHLTAHLTSAHGISSVKARDLAFEISGKSSARTNLPFDSNS